MEGVRRQSARTKYFALVGLMVFTAVACGTSEEGATQTTSSPRERTDEFDGRWELVDATFTGVTEIDPLPLTIRNGLVGGSDGCNGFGERPNGEMVSTMVGCNGTRGAFADALRAAVVTTPEVVDGQLRFVTQEVTLAYNVWVEVLASELFSILDSAAPNLDSTAIAFEQSGKPLNYRRFIRLEDGGHPAEFYIGYKTPDGLAFHIDILGDPSASRTLGNLARYYRAAAPPHWAGDVRASLIPDSHLDENNIGILSRHGELHGNLLIFDENQTTGESFELTNRRGESLSVVVPTNAQLVTGR